MIVLGIESSCDETAAAVIELTDHTDGADDRACPKGRILSSEVLSQLEEHKPYGGIVPEVAARAHLDHMDRLVAAAMANAGIEFSDLDGVAATGGPGLIGGVMVGVMTGKAIAAVHKLPFLAVNHLEGHALTARLTNDAPFPYLLLLVSGGHCQLLIVEGVGDYTRLGTTVDDALGEAFDKTAKLMGLSYPGGPKVETWAARGNAERFPLPRPMKGREGCHFSFSGLKTSVRQTLDKLPEGPLTDEDLSDLCAGFQTAAGDVLCDRTAHALDTFFDRHPGGGPLVIAGGVAANGYLRDRLAELAETHGISLIAPPAELCTDNAAMIAWAGAERLSQGMIDGLDFAPRPRWPLDPDAPPAAYAGAKA